MLIKKILFLFFGCLLTTTACAWNQSGHRTAALMVWQQLSKQEQALLTQVLEKHPRFRLDFVDQQPHQLAANDLPAWRFTQASIWPDRVRRLKGTLKKQYNRPKWHYINIPIYFSTTGKEPRAGQRVDDLSNPKEASQKDFDAVRAFNDNWKILSDTSAPGSDRALALCWILHIGADAHQPLHAATLIAPEFFPNGDRGGNEIPVRLLQDQKGRTKQNLHKVWDSMIGVSLTWLEVVQISKRLQQRYPGEVSGHVSGASVEEWVRTANHLAQERIYTPWLLKQLAKKSPGGRLLQTITLPDSYRQTHQSMAEQQLRRSSTRLAAMLSQLKR